MCCAAHWPMPAVFPEIGRIQKTIPPKTPNDEGLFPKTILRPFFALFFAAIW
jgi:hypothetical protein